MTTVTVEVSDDLMSIAERISRKNTKVKLCYALAKITKIVQKCEDGQDRIDLWRQLEKVLY